jgi:hypothetical protein
VAFQLCGRGWPESSAKTRDECNAQRLVTSEGVDKAFWVDAVVLLLGEGAEAVRAKQRALNMSKVSQQLA